MRSHCRAPGAPRPSAFQQPHDWRCSVSNTTFKSRFPDFICAHIFRVYKGMVIHREIIPSPRLSIHFSAVKQEMFFSDVTTCFNALKKAVQDITLVSVTAAQLQMGQPSLRYVERNVTASICFTSVTTYCSPEALTLVADPAAIFGVDFDNLFLVRVFQSYHHLLLMLYRRPGTEA